jgi:EmrB/QacA subfamily drug resistance transporter
MGAPRETSEVAVPSPAPGTRPWRGLALLVAGAFFMENLDGTIIATAAPRMADSLGVDAIDLNATITVYLLTLAVFIPVSGWLADRFGGRIVFCGAIAVFTLASALCALSTTLPELTAMRVLQGLGGAMMVPVGRMLVLNATSKPDLMAAIAYLTWPALAAPVIAPVLGGLLVTYASWRWIFVVNLPLGLIAFLVALRRVPDVRHDRPAPLDWWGFALTAAGLGATVFGLELLTGAQVDWLLFTASTTSGAVLLGIAVHHLRRSTHPLIDLRVLRLPTFRVTSVGGSLFRLAIGALPFLLPLMFQESFGWSPLKAGLLVIAVFVGNLGIKPMATRLMRRFGFRPVLVAANAGSGLTILLCAFVTARTPVVLIVVLLVTSGALRSIGFTAYNTIAFADIPAAGMTNANTLAAAVQQLTMGLGVAAGSLALRVGASLSDDATSRTAFGVAFGLMAVLTFIAAAESLRLDRRAGWAVSAAGR